MYRNLTLKTIESNVRERWTRKNFFDKNILLLLKEWRNFWSIFKLNYAAWKVEVFSSFYWNSTFYRIHLLSSLPLPFSFIQCGIQSNMRLCYHTELKQNRFRLHRQNFSHNTIDVNSHTQRVVQFIECRNKYRTISQIWIVAVCFICSSLSLAFVFVHG